MSPVTNALQFAQLDFSGGLWTTSKHLMPPNGCQVMDDCYPQPGGGVRAFFPNSGAMTVSGIDTVNETAEAIWGRPNTIGSSSLHRWWLVAYDGGDDFHRIYQFLDGDTAWAENHVTAGATSATVMLRAPKSSIAGGIVDGVTFVITPNNDLLRQAAGASTFTSLRANTRGPLAVHQSRLLAVDSDVFRLIFTDPGTETFAATNTLDLGDGTRGAQISLLHPAAASDLLVGLHDGRMFNVQGDLNDPTVRQLAQGPVIGSGTAPSQLQDGSIVYPAIGYGIVRTGSGEIAELLSEPLSRGQFAKVAGRSYVGSLAALREFVFAPQGHVYDLRTNAWFRCTAFNTADLFFTARMGHGSTGESVYGIPGGVTGWSIARVTPNEAEAAGRATDFTVKSAPLRGSDGRQVVIREVHVPVQTYEANAIITVTVNGTANAQTVASASQQYLRFQFNERGEHLDVTVRSQGGSGSLEAPTIEPILVGTLPGHGHLI